MALTIFHLTMTDALAEKAPGYDVTLGAVVVAADEAAARALVPCADECHCGRGLHAHRATCVWRHAELTRCDAIGTAREGAPEGLVMRDFHAG